MAFDLLAIDGKSLMSLPLARRRDLLEQFFRKNDVAGLKLSPMTCERRVALEWLERSGGALDGVIAKRAELEYRAGERAMIKVKQQRTADCVVGGFRYADKKKEVGSLLLGLYDENGLLDHVGFSSAIPAVERAAADQEARAADRAAGLHRQARRAARAAGRPSARPNGNRSSPSWSPKSVTIRSPAGVSVTAPASCAGAPTRIRSNAHSINSRPSFDPLSSENCLTPSASRTRPGIRQPNAQPSMR